MGTETQEAKTEKKKKKKKQRQAWDNETENEVMPLPVRSAKDCWQTSETKGDSEGFSPTYLKGSLALLKPWL